MVWRFVRDQRICTMYNPAQFPKIASLRIPSLPAIRSTVSASIFLIALVATSSATMINLMIAAECENVAKIGVEPGHTFFLRLRCTQCQEETANAVGVSREMNVEGIRGASVNLQIKCKGCGRSHDISFDADTPDGEWESSGPEAQRLASFECRGMDPFECEVRDGFIVTAPDGSKFEDVDLSDEWMDVDNKGNPVSISNVRTEFMSAKSGGKKKKK